MRADCFFESQVPLAVQPLSLPRSPSAFVYVSTGQLWAGAIEGSKVRYLNSLDLPATPILLSTVDLLQQDSFHPVLPNLIILATVPHEVCCLTFDVSGFRTVSFHSLPLPEAAPQCIRSEDEDEWIDQNSAAEQRMPPDLDTRGVCGGHVPLLRTLALFPPAMSSGRSSCAIVFGLHYCPDRLALFTSSYGKLGEDDSTTDVGTATFGSHKYYNEEGLGTAAGELLGSAFCLSMSEDLRQHTLIDFAFLKNTSSVPQQDNEEDKCTTALLLASANSDSTSVLTHVLLVLLTAAATPAGKQYRYALTLSVNLLSATFHLVHRSQPLDDSAYAIHTPPTEWWWGAAGNNDSEMWNETTKKFVIASPRYFSVHNAFPGFVEKESRDGHKDISLRYSDFYAVILQVPGKILLVPTDDSLGTFVLELVRAGLGESFTQRQLAEAGQGPISDSPPAHILNSSLIVAQGNPRQGWPLSVWLFESTGDSDNSDRLLMVDYLSFQGDIGHGSALFCVPSRFRGEVRPSAVVATGSGPHSRLCMLMPSIPIDTRVRILADCWPAVAKSAFLVPLPMTDAKRQRLTDAASGTVGEELLLVMSYEQETRGLMLKQKAGEQWDGSSDVADWFGSSRVTLWTVLSRKRAAAGDTRAIIDADAPTLFACSWGNESGLHVAPHQLCIFTNKKPVQRWTLQPPAVSATAVPEGLVVTLDAQGFARVWTLHEDEMIREITDRDSLPEILRLPLSSVVASTSPTSHIYVTSVPLAHPAWVDISCFQVKPEFAVHPELGFSVDTTERQRTLAASTMPPWKRQDEQACLSAGEADAWPVSHAELAWLETSAPVLLVIPRNGKVALYIPRSSPAHSVTYSERSRSFFSRLFSSDFLHWSLLSNLVVNVISPWSVTEAGVNKAAHHLIAPYDTAGSSLITLSTIRCGGVENIVVIRSYILHVSRSRYYCHPLFSVPSSAAAAETSHLWIPLEKRLLLRVDMGVAIDEPLIWGGGQLHLANPRPAAVVPLPGWGVDHLAIAGGFLAIAGPSRLPDGTGAETVGLFRLESDCTQLVAQYAETFSVGETICALEFLQQGSNSLRLAVGTNMAEPGKGRLVVFSLAPATGVPVESGLPLPRTEPYNFGIVGGRLLNQGACALQVYLTQICPGPVTTIAKVEFPGIETEEIWFLVYSAGHSLFVNEFREGVLARASFVEVPSLVSAISVIKGFLVVGDALRGVLFFMIRPEEGGIPGRRMISCLSRETQKLNQGQSRFSSFSCGFLANGSHLEILTSTGHAELKSLSYDPHEKSVGIALSNGAPTQFKTTKILINYKRGIVTRMCRFQLPGNNRMGIMALSARGCIEVIFPSTGITADA